MRLKLILSPDQSGAVDIWLCAFQVCARLNDVYHQTQLAAIKANNLRQSITFQSAVIANLSINSIRLTCLVLLIVFNELQKQRLLLFR